MMKDNIKLFVIQVLAHLGLLCLIIYGAWYHWILSLVVYLFTGCFGITMTYHRLLSHKSWNAPRWWRVFGSLCGVWGCVGSPIAWVATHRAHHRDSDGPSDPHSPLQKSWWRIQWFSMFESTQVRYAVDLLRDPFQVFIHKHYFSIHILIILTLLIEPMLVISLYLAPAAILWNAGSAVNNLGHLLGYRNTETKDNSKCNLILGYCVFGEGWHNNHHAAPASASFQRKWWEFDLGYFLIRRLDNVNKVTGTDRV
jgi:fatty-acid desaturase